MKEFKIGDVVWVPLGGVREVQVTCPVCFGKLVVHLTLGNGDVLELPCDYCAKGYEAPRGVAFEYAEKPDAKVYVIDGIERNERADCVEIAYRSDCSVLRDVYGTKEEALARAVVLAEENVADRTKRAEYIKHDKNKSYSWNAGYHRREAKRARKTAERHEERAKLCKAKGDTPC